MSDRHELPPQVHQDERRGRFEIVIGLKTAGYTAYRDEPGVRVFTHTQVEPAFEGRGLGSRLAEAALDATRAAGLRVVAECPFIASYIERHPDYADLVERPSGH